MQNVFCNLHEAEHPLVQTEKESQGKASVQTSGQVHTSFRTFTKRESANPSIYEIVW